MISIDETVIIHIINMIVLMFVLNKILYRPILEIMDKRQESLDTMTDDVEKFEQNARDRQEEVDRQMQKAGAKAKKALDAARDEAEIVGAKRIAAIREEADTERTVLLTEIHSGFDAARDELLHDVDEFAQEMAAKILGRSLKA